MNDRPTPLSADGWQDTRAQTSVNTELARNPDDYLSAAAAPPDIGRQVGASHFEFFVSCDPAQALAQQLGHLRPEYIVLHDVHTTSSKKLLAGVAAASGQPVYTLLIRRQGYGTTLASLEFVELPTATGPKLRIYSTDIDADAPTRDSLTLTLLAHSQLGVLMTGDVLAPQLRAHLAPLREAMIGTDWPNRNLLLLPLASANGLGQEGAELARGTGVHVRTAPPVARPADAWAFISSTWTRLYALAHPEEAAALASRGAEAAAAQPAVSAPATTPHTAHHPTHPHTQPAALQTAPQRPSAAAPTHPMRQAMPTPGGPLASEAIEPTLARYLRQLLELPGMVSCCVFDVAHQRTLVHAGARPSGDDLSHHGAVLLAAMTQASRTLGLGHTLPEAAITLGGHHLLLRAVPKHPGVALHAVLDKTHANLTLVRLQIGRMDALFD